MDLTGYSNVQQIGQGSFATVYSATNNKREQVAIKVIEKNKLNKKLAENLETEISILKEIKNENITQLYEIEKTDDKIYLIMEFCAGGDLSNYLKKHKCLEEARIKYFIRQLGNFWLIIANALECLRVNNLVHRDLKPQNLLLSNGKEDFILKVADFGFARFIEPSDMAETLCGSPLYMAPEILRYEKYDAKADLWSVGAIMYEMVYGRPPFRAQNHIQLLKKIESTKHLHFPSKIKREDSISEVSVSEECRDLIGKLLRKNPIERIGFEEFFLHSFFRDDSFEFSRTRSVLIQAKKQSPRRSSFRFSKSVPWKATEVETKPFADSPTRLNRSKSISQMKYSSPPLRQSRLSDLSIHRLVCTSDNEEHNQVLQGIQKLIDLSSIVIGIQDRSIVSSSQDTLALLIHALEIYQEAIEEASKHNNIPETVSTISWLQERFAIVFDQAEQLKSRILKDAPADVFRLLYNRAIKLVT